MKQHFILLALLMLVVKISLSQEISVQAVNQPLNEILVELNESYDINFSFDHNLLSGYPVTVSGTFDSPSDAIAILLQGLPLSYEKSGDVFIIYKDKKANKPKSYVFAGQIMDATSREALPYSHIRINEMTLATDMKGSFSVTTEDSIFNVRATHLGYYVHDSIYPAGKGTAIVLMPSTIGLKEVVIRNREIERSTLIGEKAGTMKVNHKVANFLPGYGDNSVFNLLRLLPGITAAGEQTNDLIIWGSYAGQSQVLFDGFPIYGLKNFNDNISAFNPLMAKDIEVHKGGYDTRFGERSGGVVNITGINGNKVNTGFSVTLNNMTLNGMVEIPMFKKRGALVIALRQTYYNLYNPSDMNFLLRRNNDADTTNDVDVEIVPDYMFRDINIKYSMEVGENDMFYISLYGANDQFSYSIDEPYENVSLMKETRETNTQNGGAAFYGKTWKSGNSTNFTFAYTVFNSEYNDDLRVKPKNQPQTIQTIDKSSLNRLGEVIIKADNRFSLHNNHILEASAGIYSDRVTLVEDTFNVKLVDTSAFASRLFLSAQDIIALGSNVILKAGFRWSYAGTLERGFFEPRISISAKAGESWKINAAWGLYDQWVVKSTLVDEQGNYRYFWTLSDIETIPVVEASHFVIGVSYHRKGWTFYFEPFFKKINGITRYFNSVALQFEGVLVGESRVRGFDVFLQKDIKKHSAWVSYTLSKTEERFPDVPNDNWRRAFHDQRHEVKAALLLNFDPFYFSTNYVYGSGFPVVPFPYDKEEEDLSYSRWDVSFIYKFLDRKVVGEAGISLLNVLNTQNIKYTNFERIPSNQENSINIYAEAIPFTPTLYLKFSMN